MSMKAELTQQVITKFSNNKFHTQFRGSGVVIIVQTQGRTDGHSEFHRYPAGIPAQLEMLKNFAQAHDFNTRGLKDILLFAKKLTAYNRVMFKKPFS
jgi:hypothetical protein